MRRVCAWIDARVHSLISDDVVEAPRRKRKCSLSYTCNYASIVDWSKPCSMYVLMLTYFPVSLVQDFLLRSYLLHCSKFVNPTSTQFVFAPGVEVDA